jgi:fused signal recognition particle receptor
VYLVGAAVLLVSAVLVWRSGQSKKSPPTQPPAGLQAAGGSQPAPETAAERLVRLKAEERAYLRAGLAKTRSEGFVGKIGQLFAGKQIDAALMQELEEVLFRADLGVKTTQSLLAAVQEGVDKKSVDDHKAVWQLLRQKCTELLNRVGARPLQTEAPDGPAVIMVVGVNGAGKTTTIGKLAHKYAGEGKKVLVAAGDTYRAAAVDQLDVWCQRAGVPIHKGKDNADPASVAFSGVERGKAEGFDLVIVDTAGRLHTNQGLMDELKKSARVCGKAQAGAPHEVLLVLDATMGQNAVKQAEQFKESVQVTGIVLTKLDGTAKGGVVLAIAETLGLPVKLIGVGEKMQDLRPFDPDLFLDELFGDAGH